MIGILICGPIVNRANYRDAAESINRLLRHLLIRHPENSVTVVTYAEDFQTLASSNLLDSRIKLVCHQDPGPDKDFYTEKKGYSNISRLLKLGISGLTLESNPWCLKTRVELLPKNSLLACENYVTRLYELLDKMKTTRQYDSAILLEDHAGVSNFRKANLASFPDTWVLMQTTSLVSLYKQSLQIWERWRLASQVEEISPTEHLRNEQIFGRGMIEIIFSRNTDDFKTKYSFSLKYCFYSLFMEFFLLHFVPSSSLSFLKPLKVPRLRPPRLLRYKVGRYLGPFLLPLFLMYRARITLTKKH